MILLPGGNYGISSASLKTLYCLSIQGFMLCRSLDCDSTLFSQHRNMCESCNEWKYSIALLVIKLYWKMC